MSSIPDYYHRIAFKMTYGHPATTPAEMKTAAGMNQLAAEIGQYSVKHGSLDGFSPSTATRGSGGDLMSLIHQAGFKGQSANIMYGIVMAESGGNAQAHNTNSGTGDNSYGLAQINMLGSMGPARLREYGLNSNNDLFDPLTNLRVAYKMSGGGSHFGDWSTYNSGAYQQHMGQSGAQVTSSGGGQGSSSGGGSGSGGGQQMTAADYSGVDGLGSLLNSIPELRQKVDEAVAGSWTPAHFQNAIEDTHWYKSYSDSARALIIQRANDPKSYEQSLNNTTQHVLDLAHQLGMPVSRQSAQNIAGAGLMSGNGTDQQWLTQQLARHHDYSGLHTDNGMTGGMANTIQQLNQLQSDYGFKWSPAQQAEHAQAILTGATTIDTYKQNLISWAKSAFPGLAQQIDGGQTVKQLADPYISSMSQLLEVDPGSLDTYTPMIRQAMQGTRTDPKAPPTPTPLWQFEKQVKTDPRWQYTSNAKDTMSTALVKVGADFGFGPNG